METVKLQDDYIIKEGDRIFTAVTGNKIDEKINNGYDYKDGINCAQLEAAADYVENQKEIPIIQKGQKQVSEALGEINKGSDIEISLFANDNKVTLKGKKSYIFVDIFNFIEFDLSNVKGELALLLNGNKAGFYDKLKNGDTIEIKWK